MVDGNIVPATYDDVPAIEGLLKKLIEAVDDDQSFTLEHALQNCRAMLSDENAHLLVAKEHSTVVGFINVTTRQTILHTKPSGLIDELVVAETSRGRGVGRTLVEAAISLCRALGCSEVEVSTEKSNVAARRFYTGCGFQEEAVLLELHLDD